MAYILRGIRDCVHGFDEDCNIIKELSNRAQWYDGHTLCRTWALRAWLVGLRSGAFAPFWGIGNTFMTKQLLLTNLALDKKALGEELANSNDDFEKKS